MVEMGENGQDPPVDVASSLIPSLEKIGVVYLLTANALRTRFAAIAAFGRALRHQVEHVPYPAP